MNILDKIVEHKKVEVALRKQQTTIAQLEKGPFFPNKTASLKKSLIDKNKTGIIAEFKRKSPSKGIINANAKVEEVTSAYFKNGASGISILTDEEFFGGSLNDLLAATINAVPLLCKDFMIDEYQFYEAKAYGAEVVLLIAACLKPAQVKDFAALAKKLGMEVLLEIHNEEELNYICDDVDVVGINNRNLKNFEVDIETSIHLFQKIPKDKVVIAESGIKNVETIKSLQDAGFKGFLIGETFMKEDNPALAFVNFVKQLNAHSHED